MMRKPQVLETLAGIAADQRGFVTSAQAQVAGVNRMTLCRLAEAGEIARAGRGAFRMTPDAAEGTQANRLDRLYLAWLMLDAKRTAPARLLAPAEDFVATGMAGAELYGYRPSAENLAGPFVFASLRRRQTHVETAHTIQHRFDARDVVVRRGMPTFDLERLVDEIVHRNDVEVASDFLLYATDVDGGLGMPIDTSYLAHLLRSYARGCGYPMPIGLVSKMVGRRRIETVRKNRLEPAA